MKKSSVKEEVPSRREQKKASIRAAIIKSAHSLFEKKGFDNVTVAEVAKSADISVKTLFQYFDTKEDIVFEDEMSLAENLMAAILNRKKGSSIFRAAVSAIIKLIEDDGDDALDQLEGFARMTDNPVLKSRLQMMWLRYEDSMTEVLVNETSADFDDVRPRLVAIQIVALLRILTKEEVRQHLGSRSGSQKDLVKWLEKNAKFISNQIGDFGSA